ncbi:MAG: hypothetical protein Q8L39_03555 [Burkholderiales bacterium]|nr:hypothetical protein [Burkholderiales bacterium]
MREKTPSLPITLHEDAFYEFFVPYRHPEAHDNIWGGHGLETYGEDLKLALSLDENYVWTVADGGDDNNQWITPNIHFVNRVCYLVTEIPHNGFPIEFRIPHPMTSLTPLGLKRQVNKLKRTLSWWNGASKTEKDFACRVV